jgi:hypothetical protein
MRGVLQPGALIMRTGPGVIEFGVWEFLELGSYFRMPLLLSEGVGQIEG